MDALRFSCGAPQALVLLPGAQMQPQDIVAAGLPELLAASGAALDLVLPALHLDPTGAVDAVQRLRAEWLQPLAESHERVWLGGISLGGLLALRAAQCDAAGLAGLLLLAPYPGSRLTTNAIARAGGLRAWVPTAAQDADPEFQLWRDLRAGRPDLPAFIGWGRDDRFADTIGQLADRLPQAQRRVVDGGHDWPAWRPLLRHALAWLATPRESLA